jgi:catechol 2,3-dioxygenase-like lactoylglutathione lyase family enzyme
MFDHVQIKVKDLKRSIAFYKAALEPLGWEQSGDGFVNGSESLYLGEGTPVGSVHIAFAAKTRGAVEKFHEGALEHKGKDNGKPGPRPDYSKTYWAAFVIDPDGNNIEAVTHSAR